MSSTPQRQGLSKTYLSNGVKTFRSVKTRLFAASAFLLVAAFFSFAVTAANPNQSTLAPSSANTQQAGFVASSITDLLSFFGLAEAEPVAAMSPQVCTPPSQPANMTVWLPANGTFEDIAPQDAVADVATPVGAVTFGPGRVGTGFSLTGGDGTGSYVSIAPSVDTGSSVGTANTGNISMNAWINPTSTATFQPIAEYGSATETGVHFYVAPGGQLYVNLVDEAGANHVFTSTTSPVTTGTLQHVAFTFDNATDTVIFYYNGAALTTTAGGGGVPDIETDPALNVGGRVDPSGGPLFRFQGIIDEFQLYNAVLTPASVASIASAPAGEGNCSGTFQFSTPAQTATEGTTQTVTVTRTGDTTQTGTVRLSTLNGSALSVDGTGCAAGNDFQGFSAANPIILTFVPGDTSESASVFICDDGLAETDEQFTLNLTNPTGNSNIGTPATQTITITDAADNPVSVTVAPGAVDENGNANLVFTFTRPTPVVNPPANGFAQTVNFTISGSATPGTDYVCSASTGATAATCAAGAGASSVTFAATATTAQVIVDPTPDGTVEGDETVTFTVVAGTGYTVGTPSSATGTITEDDTNVSVAVSDNDPATAVIGEVNEDGAGVITFTFTRSGALTAGQVVGFSVSGTACSLAPCSDNFPPDYTVSGATTFTGTNGTVPGSGTVTFAGNATTATVTIDPTPDNNIEFRETVTLTVTGSGTPGGAGPTINPVAGSSSATGAILDDQNESTYTIAATPATAPEGTGNTVANPQAGGAPAGSFATFTVTRTGNLTLPGNVDIAAVPFPTTSTLPANADRATPGAQNTPCGNGPADFILDGTTLFFAAGVATQTFTVAICGDNRFELDEVFDAILSNPVNGIVGVPGRATYRIDDDDAFPVLNISDGQAAEGNAITFTVTQVNQAGAAGTPLVSSVDTTFRFCTTDITATHMVDYTGQPCAGGGGSAVQTIPAGQTSVTFTVPTATDTIFEGDETFLVDLFDVFNAVEGDGQGVGTITDGQRPNVFTVNDVAQAEGSVPAGTTSFNFVVTRSAAAQGNQVVCYKTVSGNMLLPGGGPNPATPGTAPGNPPTPANADYTEITPGPQNCVTFTQGGPDSIIVPVIVYQDQVFENDETFTFMFVSVTGGPAGSDISDIGIGTILNDDLAPILRVRTVNPNPIPGTPPTPAGSTITSQLESVSPYTFRVERIGQSQLPATFVFTTSDGSAPFAQAAGTGPATGGPSPCGAPAVPTKDYISIPPIPGGPPAPTFFTIPGDAGAADPNGANGFVDIGVVICNDAVRELNETFVGTVSMPTNSVIIPFGGGATGGAAFAANPSAALATIVDDDGAPIITVSDVSLAEGNPPGTTDFNFTITLTGSTTLPVTITYSTVDGTAVAPGDYTATTGTVTFAPGETTKTVTVPVIRDLANEVDETFTLQVTSATNASLDPNQGADAVGLGTILNDDGPRTFAIDNVTRPEGNDPANPVVFRFRVTGTGTSAFGQTITFTVQDSNTPNSGLTATGGTICGGVTSSSPDFTTPMVENTGSTFTLTFAAGGTTFQDILVPICADTVQEANETFTITIASSVPGTVPPAGSVGTGTIVNDDAVGGLVFRVDNVTVQEGNAGTTNAVVRISKEGFTALSSTVSFVVENAATGAPATGGAACGPGIDYVSAPLTTGGSSASPVTFTADQQFREIIFQICGDVTPETDEVFAVRLTSTSSNATVSSTNGTGVVTIVNDDGIPPPAGLEGDINRAVLGVCGPGDGQHTAADSAQFKRFIAGLDTPCTGNGLGGTFNEFQRADTAPEDTLGDGRLTAADQQQIDNYIARLDPARPAGGPTAPVAGTQIAERSGMKLDAFDKGDDAVIETGGGREFRGVLVSGAPDTFVEYAVELISQGDETVTTFSLQFDQTRLSINGTSGTNNNPDVIVGDGVSPATSRTVNATQIANGRIGVLLDFQGPVTAGTRQVVRLRFRILPTAPAGLTPITFVDQPIVRSTSNAQAQALNAKYTPNNVNVVIGPGGGARTVTIQKTTAANGGQAIVPVVLASQGNETGISGSVSFAVGSLTISNVSGTGTNPDVIAGGGLPAGCTVTTNGTEVAQGRLGFLVACPTAFTAGNREVVRLRFGVPAGAPVPRSAPITWVNTPVAQGVTDANAVALTTTFVNGAVNIDITTAASGTISGLVTDANGMGIRNAIITISGVGLAEPVQVATSSLGYFSVEGLDIGETYLVSLRASKRYQFSNATRLVTLTDYAQAVNFTAEQ